VRKVIVLDAAEIRNPPLSKVFSLVVVVDMNGKTLTTSNLQGHPLLPIVEMQN
jgi:hypothetical protein